MTYYDHEAFARHNARLADQGVSVERDNGWIYLDGRRLSPRDARDLAVALTDAIRLSRDRVQVGTLRYTDSAQILDRDASPIGVALAALRRIF